MNQKTIEVVIGPAGEIRIDAQGFSGADCEKATAFLENALGAVAQKSRKPEYYRPAEIKQEQRIGQ